MTHFHCPTDPMTPTPQLASRHPDRPSPSFVSRFHSRFVPVAGLLALIAGCASSPPTCTPEDQRVWAAANAGAISSVNYPEQARAQGIEGTVRLGITIDDADSVRQVLVESSSGHAELDEAALDAARAGTFKSPVCGGRKLARSFVVPIDFKLEK